MIGNFVGAQAGANARALIEQLKRALAEAEQNAQQLSTLRVIANRLPEGQEPTAAVEYLDNEIRITLGIPDGATGPQGDAFTYEDFTQEQLEALRGQAGRDGTDGRDGRDGKDGVSPQVNVQPIDGGYQVIISTETSREVIDLMHGQNGQDGKDGAEGYTPQKNVDYFDGKDGQDGKSGVYVGSGEMPEGYNVQIDPGGEIEPFPAAVAVDALPEATKDRRGSFALVSEGNTDKLYICMMVAGAYSWFPVGSTSGGDTEDDTATTSILGQAVLGTMILGG